MEKYLKREISDAILRAKEWFKVIVVTGPRQVGKTTLCRNLFNDFKYFNLENISIKSAIKDDPVAFMDECGDKVVIDEVQNYPEILSYIQVVVDEQPERKFVLTGSNNFSLLENVTQSLAGRAALFTLLPFSFRELGDYPAETDTDTILTNGFYPAVLCNHTPVDIFYPNYYSTYIERDLHKILNLRNIDAFNTFVRLCANRIGSELNMASIATTAGVSGPTIKEWLSVLKASYVAFTLPPFFANLDKRLTKAPKLYFYDTGVACMLLGIETPGQLLRHPMRGALFENVAVLELLKSRYNKGKRENLMYYRENSGKEVDILQQEALGLNLYEVKASKTYSSGFRTNMNDLAKLLGDQVLSQTVVYDGQPLPPTLLNIRNI